MEGEEDGRKDFFALLEVQLQWAGPLMLAHKPIVKCAISHVLSFPFFSCHTMMETTVYYVTIFRCYLHIAIIKNLKFGSKQTY